MSDASAGPDGVVVSVRGEAALTLAPDQLTLRGGIRCQRGSKPDALAATAGRLAELTGGLAGLGGVVLTLGAGRPPLGWLAAGAVTYAEYEHDPERGVRRPTGQYTASSQVAIRVRDFGLLEPVGRLLAGVDELDVVQVSWEVDEDNPAWADVRAEAIRAAVRRGRDYAAALGAALERVEHVADTGLLAGPDRPEVRMARRAAAFAGGGPEGELDLPSLEPEPQEIRAVIEARLGAGGVDLAGL